MWGIELWVEGDGEQPVVREGAGQFDEFFRFGEVVGEKWAVGGEGATGEEEGEGEGLSEEVMELEGLAELIGERAIGYGVTGREFFGEGEFTGGGGGLLGGEGASSFFDGGDPGVVGGDVQGESDLVAGIDLVERPGIAGAEGHGHCHHVIGDGVMLDDGGLSVGLDSLDDTGDGVGLGWGLGGGLLGFATGAEEQGGGDCGEGCCEFGVHGMRISVGGRFLARVRSGRGGLGWAYRGRGR